MKDFIEEEELEEVEEEELVDEEELDVSKEQEGGGMKPESKNALLAFIFAVVGFAFAFASYASIGGVIFGIVSLVFHKKIDKEVTQQPFRVFGKIAKIVAIVDIICGAISFLIWIIVAIVLAATAAAAAANA